MSILIFSGAGISKESGIPTFEELGEDFRLQLDREFFKQHPEQFYQSCLKMYDACEAAKPNEAHRAIAKHNLPVITMNVDGLHQKAGSTDVLELHGNIQTVSCNYVNPLPERHKPRVKCGHYSFELIRTTLHCPKCNTTLQPNMVLYGDQLFELDVAYEKVHACDTLIIVGTSFYTSTSALIYEEAIANNKEVYIINKNASVDLPRLLDHLLK